MAPSREASTGCGGECRGWRERSDRDRRSPRLAEGGGARGYDREPVRGTHRGRRPVAVETGWMAAAETRTPDATKPLRGGRRPWMENTAGSQSVSPRKPTAYLIMVSSPSAAPSAPGL